MGPIRYSFATIWTMLSLLMPPDANAEEAVRTGRYIEVESGPLPEQLDLLLTTVFLEFDKAVQTVGDAVAAVLDESGFRLSAGAEHQSERETLLEFPLPKIHRVLGPMSVREALQTLASEGWELVEDPVNRMVTFRRCDRAKPEGHKN